MTVSPTSNPMGWLPSDDTPLLDAAIAYASHGFRVLPVWGVQLNDGVATCRCGRRVCRSGGEQEGTVGKHPIERSWQKKATSDADGARDARRGHADANIGIAMGGEARLVAVDIDGEQGRASWAELEAGVEPAPVTLTSRSGRADGGEHRIYSVPAHLDIKRLGNRASFRKMGIDTRIDNGQIVVAPSVHRSGARYTWSIRAPIAELPEWLFEALAAPVELGRAPLPPPSVPTTPSGQVVDFARAYVRSVISNAAKGIAEGKPGQRNQLLFAKACTVFEYHVGEGLDHLDAWRAIADAGRAAGLPEGEVSSTLSKAWKKAQAQPRRVPPPTLRESAPAAAPVPAPPASGTATSSPTTAPASANSTSWEASLAKTGEGYVKTTFGNVCKILRHAEAYAGRLSFHEMKVTPMFNDRTMTGADFGKIRERIEGQFGVGASKEMIVHAVETVSAERSYHPVRRYLEGLEWDQSERIGRISTQILGFDKADDLTQRMLRCWFISAVARALSPGCKVDTALVLVGPQGFKKSTFFSILGGDWFSDSYQDITTKDGVLQVHAAWILEWAEIEKVTTRRSSSDVKSFITIARDDLRPPYGTGIINQARSGVIVGTTNKEFLEDETGSRRFWPVRIKSVVNTPLLREWRDQLWAEAVAAYRGSEEWWLTDEEEKLRELAASEHQIEDAWMDSVAAMVARKMTCGESFGTVDILVGLGLDASKQTVEAMRRVAKCLKGLGYDNKRISGADRRRVWRPT